MRQKPLFIVFSIKKTVLEALIMLCAAKNEKIKMLDNVFPI